MMKVIVLSILFCASTAFAGWNPVGPYGGIITSMVVAKDGIYIGTDGSGVFFSNDNGKNWEGRRKGLANLHVESLAISGENIYYAGTRDGIFKSLDGKDWQPLASIPTGSAVKNIAFDSDGNLYASLWGSGIYICKKDSECVNSIKELSSPYVHSILINDSGNVIVSTEGGVFVKRKGEEKWQLGGLQEYMIVPAISFDGQGVLYAGTWAGGIHYFDKGDWHFRSVGAASSMVAVLAKGPDGNLYAGTEGGASVLVQGNDTWSPLGLDNIYIKTIGFGGNGEIYAGSYGKGFFAREKGKEWEERNKGISNSNILSLAFSDKGEIFAGTKQGLYISKKGDDNWIEVSNLYGMKINAFLIEGKQVYAGTSNGLFARSASGKDWKRVAGEIGYMPVTSLTCVNSIIYAGTDSDGVFSGVVGKGEFKALNEGLENFRIRNLVTFDNANVYAGTYEGVYTLQKGLGRWIKMGLQDSVIVSLAVNGVTIYAAAENRGVFAFADGRWVSIDGDLPNKRIMTVFHSDKTLYAGGYGWVAAKDGDGPWKEISGPLSSTVTQTLSADKKGKVYAGTWGSGIWRMDLLTETLK